MSNWYAAETGNHQGLVIEEGTGRNVAVTYEASDAALVAAAPALQRAAKRMFAARLALEAASPASDCTAQFEEHAAALRELAQAMEDSGQPVKVAA